MTVDEMKERAEHDIYMAAMKWGTVSGGTIEGE